MVLHYGSFGQVFMNASKIYLFDKSPRSAEGWQRHRHRHRYIEERRLTTTRGRGCNLYEPVEVDSNNRMYAGDWDADIVSHVHCHISIALVGHRATLNIIQLRRQETVKVWLFESSQGRRASGYIKHSYLTTLKMM